MLASGEGGRALEGKGDERRAKRRRQNTDCPRRSRIFVIRFSFFFTGWHGAETGGQMWRQQDETEMLREGPVGARRGVGPPPPPRSTRVAVAFISRCQIRPTSNC